MQEESQTLKHAAELIDQEQPDVKSMEDCLSSPEELELLRIANRVGGILLEESQAMRQMEEEDWKRFAAQHQPRVTLSIVNNTDTQVIKHRKSFWWGAITGAAASLLICICAGWMWWNYKPQPSGLIAFEANHNSTEILLETSQGNSITITKAFSEDTLSLANLGVTLHDAEPNHLANTSDKLLDYQSTMASETAVEQHRLTVPEGKDMSLLLADGTTVYLNAGSRLEYPSRFDGPERIVTLTGEAYFEVTKDAAHPFIVQTQQLSTRVLGTSFSVRSYEHQQPIVALVEGAVQITSQQHPDNPLLLSPGQIATVQEGGSLSLLDEDIDQYTYWHTGYFYYDEKPLIEIMTEVGRWYNCNVIFENETLTQLRMHYFCNRQDSIEEAIRILNYQPDIHITISNNTVYIR